MSLAKGDHLVIKRNDKVLGPDDEAYHEFEVMDFPVHEHPEPNDSDTRVVIKLPSGIRVVA